MTLQEAVRAAIQTPGLVEEFDRLNQTNLQRKGTNLDLQIDQASGRLEHDMRLFVEFVQECLLDRL